MRKMTDKEIKARAALMTKRHRSEWARFVYEASVGRTMQEVAAVLGRGKTFVQEHLQWYAVESTVGGRDAALLGKREEMRELVKTHKPAEPDEDYVAEYETKKHTPEVAKCLAVAYEAGENAKAEGILQTAPDKKTSQIVVAPANDWETQLAAICGKIKAATRALDSAKMSDVRRVVTRKRVAEVHAAWMFQVERIVNVHPTFEQEVMEYET